MNNLKQFLIDMNMSYEEYCYFYPQTQLQEIVIIEQDNNENIIIEQIVSINNKNKIY